MLLVRLNVIIRGFIQSSCGDWIRLLFPNAFYGLFVRWICKINPKDSRHGFFWQATLSDTDLHYKFKHEMFVYFYTQTTFTLLLYHFSKHNSFCTDGVFPGTVPSGWFTLYQTEDMWSNEFQIVSANGFSDPIADMFQFALIVIYANPDTPDGPFPKSLVFISWVHLVKSS